MDKQKLLAKSTKTYIGLCLLVALLFNIVFSLATLAKGFGGFPAGSAPDATAQTSLGEQRAAAAQKLPLVKKLMNEQQGRKSAQGNTPYQDGQAQPTVIERTRRWPTPGGVPAPYAIKGNWTPDEKTRIMNAANRLQINEPGGDGPATDAGLSMALNNALEAHGQYMSDPAAQVPGVLAGATALSTSAANSMAGAAVSQSMGAIEFTRHYLVNFTAQAGSSWQSLRNNLFVPIAILLLLPGAVLAQVRAIIAQGSPILGEISPFEGITRAIVAIFLIPASFLVVNYGIDVANSLTYSISTEYQHLFGTDMYQDAECAEMRAFPVNNPSQNMNAFLPIPISLPPIMKDPWSAFESVGVANKLFDPCVGLNISNVPDEDSSSTMNTNRMMMNGSNAFLAMTWNIMCAFQTVFLYYLWCMGPIVAALWVWPMEKLRSALPSWVEGVVTLCFWSLFWNVVVLLIACFRGVSETGTVVMTALNSLATISVWYAFDFSTLISQGAGWSMMNAISQALSQQSRGGGGGGGGGGAQSAAGRGGAGGGIAAGPGAGFTNPQGSFSSPFGAGTRSVPGGIIGAANVSGPGSLAVGGVTTGPASAGGLFPGGTAGGPLRSGLIGTNAAGGYASTGSLSQIPTADFNNMRNAAFRQLTAAELEKNQRNENTMRGEAALRQASMMDQATQQMRQQQQQQQQQVMQDAQKEALKVAEQQAVQMRKFAEQHPNATWGNYFAQQQKDNGLIVQSGSVIDQLRQDRNINLDKMSVAEFKDLATPMQNGFATMAAASMTSANMNLPPGTDEYSRNLAANIGSAAGYSATAGYTTVQGDSLGSTPPLTYSRVSYEESGSPNVIVSQVEGSTTTTESQSGVTLERRDDQAVDWQMARLSSVDEAVPLTGQPIYTAYSQSARTDYVSQSAPPPSEQVVQYMPIETRQVVQSPPPQEIQEVVIHKQPAQQEVQEIIVQKPPVEPVKSQPPVEKKIDQSAAILASPPVVPKSDRDLSSLLYGKQPGIKPKPNEGTPQTGDAAGSPASGSEKISSSEETKEISNQTGSLAEHMARLRRGGGRIAPQAKDVLDESDLPPQVSEQTDKQDKEDS